LRTRQQLEITFVSTLGRFWSCWHAFGDVSFEDENFETRVVVVVKVTFKLSFGPVT
jgi:hypothetical protein